MDLSEYGVTTTDDDQGQNWLVGIGGPSGFGKTTCLRTIPNASERLLIADVEGKTQTLAGLGIPKLRIVSFDVAERKYWHEEEETPDGGTQTVADFTYFMQLIRKPEFKKRFDWIAIDSFSKLDELCWEAAERELGNSRNKYAVPTAAKKRMHGLIDEFRRDLPYNVVLIARAAMMNDELRGTVLIRPSFKGSLRDNFPYEMDEMFYAQREKEDGKERYVWLTKETGKADARDALGLPEKIDQDFALIEQAIEEKYSGEAIASIPNTEEDDEEKTSDTETDDNENASEVTETEDDLEEVIL